VFLRGSSKNGLPVCRDLANHTKHLALNSQYSVAPAMAYGISATVGVEPEKNSFSLKFQVELPTEGKSIDVLELAKKCIEEWDAIMKTIGLL
jgi:hypothetical protein